MKHADRIDEIQANLERSNQAVEAAEKLLYEGYYDFAASRAYYAVFYAASALLLHEGREFSKHSGVISAIHHHFIKSKRLETQHGKEINWLFELRNIGDYGVSVHVPEHEAKKAIDVSRRFIHAAYSLIQNKDSNHK
ncbi:MAG: HEPN domain-containing protein [Desulfohalobiaceae bacterium]